MRLRQTELHDMQTPRSKTASAAVISVGIALFIAAPLPAQSAAQPGAGQIIIPPTPQQPSTEQTPIPPPSEQAPSNPSNIGPVVQYPPPKPTTPLNVASYPVEFTYGSSVECRTLIGYTFGDGPNKTLIHASIHGNERDTKPLAEKLIAYLTRQPEAYAGCTVEIIPCVNPDGWAHDTRVNAHKVDLNRNFPVDWKPSVKGKLSRGGTSLSEPESTALAKLIREFRPEKLISIHNPLHMLDHSGPHGLELAKIMSAHDGYQIPVGGVGYPTPGSLGQFETSLGISGVTLELPAESADAAWKQNQGALLAAIQATLP